MIQRELQSLLLEYAESFRSVLIVGPRQSGKTTLARHTFPEKTYVSLENPDERETANYDPKAFLNRYPNGAVLDEVQRAPILLNYLQEILDHTHEDGLFILTGSNNILLQEEVTQSLAGRIAVLDLLPLSYREIHGLNRDLTIDKIILKGFYPEIHNKNRNPKIWYPAYIRTYIERDVRQLKQIDNTLRFQSFVKLCAGSIGQQINLSALGNACGIDSRTAQSWLSVLESTYVIYRLQPFYNNYKKRIVKAPKLYFYDTGLACALLNIKKKDEFQLSHFRGALVENFIITEMVKNNINQNTGCQYFYWRDNNGVEVDLVQLNGNDILPMEIKSAQTYTRAFGQNLKKFMSYSKVSAGRIIYNGEQEFRGSDGIELIHWKKALLNK